MYTMPFNILAKSNQTNKPKISKTIQMFQNRGIVLLIIKHCQKLYYLVIKIQTLKRKCLLYNVKLKRKIRPQNEMCIMHAWWGRQEIDKNVSKEKKKRKNKKS